MRLPVLAALLAAGLAGPANAVIDLGPIGYGAENKIFVPVEHASLGDFTDEFVFTLTDLPRPTGKPNVSVRADNISSFERPFLRLVFESSTTTLVLTGGGISNIPMNATMPIAFSLKGKVVDLPAGYEIRLAVTPAPATLILAASGLGALVTLGRRARASQR